MVMGELTQETEVLVIGSGPGGYAAAFRAADLGLEVTMVDPEPRPGGECLFRGCIPSKTYLYLSELIHDAKRAEAMGVIFGRPRIDLDSLRAWKQKIVDQLANGLLDLSNRRGVQLVQGTAVFEGSGRVRLSGAPISHIQFKNAILATGSHPAPFREIKFKKGSRVMDSASALELTDIPESLLVIGGGYIALELGTVYASLGSRVTIAVRSGRLLRGADPDLVAPLITRLNETFEAIHFNTTVSSLEENHDHVKVKFEGGLDKDEQTFDRVLIAVGRKPNSVDIGLETTKVKLDDRGFVMVDEYQRTTDERIFAVGDVAGGMLLAHKASREGKVAAEVIAGEPSAFDARAIPSVVYTDPQVSWCGLTEQQAEKEQIFVKVERFPWKFSGRAMTMGVGNGLTKILIRPETGQILGVGISGRDSEGLISEGVLAVEMGALAEDLALSVHPHPTLSETEAEAAEIFIGSAIHVPPNKKRK